MRWDGNVVCLAEMRGACRVLIWKPEGKNNMEDVCYMGG
jgi:hypothetical protein